MYVYCKLVVNREIFLFFLWGIIVNSVIGFIKRKKSEEINEPCLLMGVLSVWLCVYFLKG